VSDYERQVPHPQGGEAVAQKLLPPRSFIDAPLALTIVALGILVVVAPSSIPGLTPTM
jgi:hypothetical protein